MNPKVEEVIEKQKKRIKEQELADKEKLLIKLGLVDEKIKDFAYAGGYKPMEVTDEEYAEICKYYSPNNSEYKLLKSDNLLRIMSTIFLVLGLLSAIVLFFCNVTDYHGHFNPISLFYLISISLTSLITYAFGIAIADIVKNTRK